MDKTRLNVGPRSREVMIMQTATRRNFLQHGAAATSAMVVPYWLTSRRSRAASANGKLNVASIGVGGRGTAIGHQAGKLGNMIACADVNRQHAEKFAAKYEGKCQIYSDYRDILARGDVDVITCGTPDHWHTKISIDAMRAGIDVYCEKPLTLTLAESQHITRAAEETGRVLQVGTQQRSEFSQYFIKAVAIARSGRLGDKLRATCSLGQPNSAEMDSGPFAFQPVPDFMEWDLYLGQAPPVDYCVQRTTYDFRWWLEYSGGQITDWGVHHADIAFWALDGMNSNTIEVQGSGLFPGVPDTANIIDFLNGREKLPNQYNVPTEFKCVIELDNGNSIEINNQKNEILIEGDQGTIRVNRGGLTGKPVEEIEKSPSNTRWLNEEVQTLTRGLPLNDHMLNFFHCIDTREKPISDLWTHLSGMNACHMANIAMLLKRRIVFDCDRYAFRNDAEANQLMSRVQRDPWRTDT